MGCLYTKIATIIGASKNMSTPRKKSSVWVMPNSTLYDLDKDEWVQVVGINSLLRSQGTDIDVAILAFEKLFLKDPSIKRFFIESGLLNSVDEDIKLQTRFRGHMREIALGLNTFIVLKNSDQEAFDLFIIELSEIHSRVKGLDHKHFELLAHCLEDSLLTSLGSTVTREQKLAYRKFLIFMAKTLSEGLDASRKTSTSGKARHASVQIHKKKSK